ncbi:MAG: hypothetical protein ACLQIB_02055 [Isosphaeraceae bacterium]
MATEWKFPGDALHAARASDRFRRLGLTELRLWGKDPGERFAPLGSCQADLAMATSHHV